jgi:hypothetical protein
VSAATAAADIRDIVADALGTVRSAASHALSDYDSTATSIREEIGGLSEEARENIATWLDDTRDEIRGIDDAISEALAETPDMLDPAVLLEEVSGLLDSIVLGLHDEPRSVAEVGERLRDILERWQ